MRNNNSITPFNGIFYNSKVQVLDISSTETQDWNFILTYDEIRGIQLSWNFLKPRHQEFGYAIISALDISSNYPTKFDVHDFSKNSMSLINLMDYWISRLSSLHYIYDEIMSITIGQTDKFITQTEYEQVRNAVIENLSNSLRIIWTEGLQKAWITFIELISDILIRTQKELVNSIK
jgi:hypothetical protein